MPSRVVDYLVRAVSTLGVRHIFGVDGANIEDLYDALFDAPYDVAGIVAKHEFSAATMADGYARSTGRLGVVAATSGGGAMNLVAGLAESFASRVPVLALVGQPPTALEGNGAFQDSSGLAGTIDAARMFGEITSTAHEWRPPPTCPTSCPGQSTPPGVAAPRSYCCPRMYSRAISAIPRRSGRHRRRIGAMKAAWLGCAAR